MDNNQKDPIQSQILVSWKAPLRPYKKNVGKVLRFYIAVALILSSFVFFFGDNMLILPTWAVVFLLYILTITPPPEVENKITVFGIETAGITARWEMLSYFYFKKKFGFDIVVIVSHAPYFYHMYLVIPNKTIKDKIIPILAKRLAYKNNPNKGITEKIIDSFSKIIPKDDQEVKINVPSKNQVVVP